MSQNQKDDDIEARRVLELKKYEILDTPPELVYNDIVFLASSICGTPISLVSLVDVSRQWFKSCVGLDVSETARDIAFCNYVVQDKAPLIVEDAMKDERFKNNPLVTGGPKIRFYAGVPIMSGSFVLGSLCVLDTKPRTFSQHQLQILEGLSRQVTAHLDLRFALKQITLAQKKSIAEKEKYAILLDSLKEAVFQMDNNGQWTFLSSSWQDFMGYTVIESVGTNFNEYVYAEDRLKAQQYFGLLARKEKMDLREQIRYVNKSGKMGWLEFYIRSTLDKEGAFAGATGTLTDISEQKMQEQTLESQRAKIVQSARLFALGEMAAGIAHEINNPLAIIRGSAHLLTRALQNPPLNIENAKTSLLNIDTTVGRIAKIVSGLRAFAREGGQDPFVDVKVNTLVTDALELCQTRFKNHGVRLELENSLVDVVVSCRSAQISQAILNLLNNAFDAVAESAEKRILIQLVDNQLDVEIRILDTGPGVPIENCDKLMQPFFSTKGPNRGMGLGLSLSKGLIEIHKGTLTYEPANGQTCFVIRLPKGSAHVG